MTTSMIACHLLRRAACGGAVLLAACCALTSCATSTTDRAQTRAAGAPSSPQPRVSAPPAPTASTSSPTSRAAVIRRAASLPTPTPIAVPAVSSSVRSTLPVADTYGRVPKAKVDRSSTPTGTLVHVDHDLVAFDAPGGTPVAVVPDQEVGVDTWLPVTDTRPGWWQVRLPSRPNDTVAWIPAKGLSTKTTAYRIVVSLHHGTMTLRRGRHVVGHWSVGHGRPSLPTPAARTFVMTRFHDPNQSFSPVIFALGAHSDAMGSFEGGPGTIAIHGWPTYDGRHGAVSHGCVRVPDGALTALRKVPNGTPVRIAS